MSKKSNSSKKNINNKENTKKNTDVTKANSNNKKNTDVAKVKADTNKNMKKKNSDLSQKKGQSLELTTRIRIDRDRLNDTGTLDTSFLENKKQSTNKRKILIDEERMMQEQEKEEKQRERGSLFKDLILTLLFIGVLILSFIVVDKYSNFKQICPKEKTKVKTETLEVDKYILDDNYLFLGDFLTDKYDLDKYYEDMFVVKSTNNDGKIADILDNLKDLVYIYNPSKVFIEVGLNDVLDEEDDEEIVSKIEELIDKIKENRSYSELYIESIYPVNNDLDEDLLEDANEKIISINEKILNMTKEKKVKYIDIYDALADENDKLDEKYTDDGKNLNEDGYDIVTEEIKKSLNM